MRAEYLVGLDLGQSIDYTALAVAEVVHVLTGELEPVPGMIGQSRGGAVVPITRPKTEKRFHVRHLERFELGMSYPRMVEAVTALLDREPLKSADTTLLLDRTGVGRPVSDLFELADLNCTLVPVGIHGGDHETRDGAAWSVPKRDLVASTQTLLQQGRLKIAAGLPLASVLAEELGAFQVRISQSGHDSYSAREGQHDDLLLALSLVAWYGADEAETQFFGIGSISALWGNRG